MNLSTAINQKFNSYVQLTKPRIVFLFTLTGIVTMVLEGSLLNHPFQFLMISFGRMSIIPMRTFIDLIQAVDCRHRKLRLSMRRILIGKTLLQAMAMYLLETLGITPEIEAI